VKSHVIDFFPTGEVEAMHNDKFDLSFLGPQRIYRATEIKFNEGTQKWAICEPMTTLDDWGAFAAYPGADGFATYEGARMVEVEWLNEARLMGVQFDSQWGTAILYSIRDERKL
jgi:hypothetical protein